MITSLPVLIIVNILLNGGLETSNHFVLMITALFKALDLKWTTASWKVGPHASEVILCFTDRWSHYESLSAVSFSYSFKESDMLSLAMSLVY